MVIAAMRGQPAVAAVQEQACAAIQEQACAVVSIIAFSDEKSVKVASAGGIEMVIAAMSDHPAVAAVQEQACWSLLAITTTTRSRLRQVGALRW